MKSPFLYRLKVLYSRGKGQRILVPDAQIYAIKAGDQSPPWPRAFEDVEILRSIASAADGERVLTVCTNILEAFRNLEDREIISFELHIKDTRVRTEPTEERKTVATITCTDMVASKRIRVDPKLAKLLEMSCEPLPNELYFIFLDFHDSDGGPVFTRYQ
jgi:hypothetical protein